MNLFNAIEACLESNPHGWCTLEKAEVLASIVAAMRPQVTVEIGVFGGRSALPIALAHKFNGTGTLYAIDPWKTEASIEGYSGEDREWWSKIDHEEIYQFFLKRIVTFDLKNFIHVVRAKSDTVNPPEGIGLLHVDGQHTDQAVRDVERFAPKVLEGGFVVTDDENWTGGGVQRAVERLLSFGFKRLYHLGSGGVYQR